MYYLLSFRAISTVTNNYRANVLENKGYCLKFEISNDIIIKKKQITYSLHSG